MSVTPVAPLPKSIRKADFVNEFRKFKTNYLTDVTPTTRHTFTFTHQIQTLAWSPLGALIATGSGDGTLRVWNPERPEARYSTQLTGHTGGIEKVAFNPMKVAELATCGADGTVRVWDVRTKKATKELKFKEPCTSLAWHALGEGLLVTRKDEDVGVILTPVEYPSFTVLPEHRQSVLTNHPVFAWTGVCAFVPDNAGNVMTFRWPSLEIVSTIQLHSAALYTCDITPNGDFVALGGADSLITLWDYNGWMWKRSFAKIMGPVRSIGFSFDSQYVVGGTDGSAGLHIEDVYSGEHVHTINTGTAKAPAVQWSPRSYALAYSVGESYGGLKVVGNFEHKTS